MYILALNVFILIIVKHALRARVNFYLFLSHVLMDFLKEKNLSFWLQNKTNRPPSKSSWSRKKTHPLDTTDHYIMIVRPPPQGNNSISLKQESSGHPSERTRRERRMKEKDELISFSLYIDFTCEISLTLHLTLVFEKLQLQCWNFLGNYRTKIFGF